MGLAEETTIEAEFLAENVLAVNDSLVLGLAIRLKAPAAGWWNAVRGYYSACCDRSTIGLATVAFLRPYSAS